MEALPFIVVHGWWLSKLFVVLAALPLMAICLRVRTQLALRKARRKARELDRSVRPLAEGRVTVRGVLHGGEAISRHHPRRTERLGSGRPWLAVNQTEVDLEGSVDVISGTSSRSFWWTTRRAARTSDAAYSDPGSRIEYILRNDDDVFATGVAHLRTSSELGLSSEQRCWVMTDVTLHAVRPAADARALGPKLILVAAACIIVAAMGLQKLGTHLLRVAGTARVGVRLPNGISGFDPAAIAAALPGAREDALTEIAFASRFFARTEHSAKQRIGLAELRQGCAGRVSQLLREGRFAESLAAASSCGDESARVSAFLFNARYDLAAALMTSANATFDERMVGLIATRQWSNAADLLDEIASRPSPRRLQYACLAAIMRRFHGEQRQAADGDASPSCRVWRELAAGGEKTKDVLKTPEYDVAGVRALMGATDADSEPWLATSTTARARWHVYEGDFRAAEHVARGSAALAVAFRSGATIRIDQIPSDDPALHAALNLRAGRIERSLQEYTNGAECHVDITDMLAAAIAGNELPLSEALESCRDFQIRPWAVLAVEPFIRSPRFGKIVDHAFAQQDLSSHEVPFTLVSNLAIRRDLSRLGGGAHSDELQALINRHMEAFRHREQVIALILVRSID